MARPSCRVSVFLFNAVFYATLLAAQTSTPAQCVDCHTKTTPNIVSDWKLSKHSGVEVTCVT